jgi:hypothetical protein
MVSFPLRFVPHAAEPSPRAGINHGQTTLFPIGFVLTLLARSSLAAWVAGWTAADYVEKLYSVFRASGRYRDIVSRNTRCVVLDYANDFHLDVVPCMQDINGETRTFWVCNRQTNNFERTAPEKYNDWLATQNTITTGNSLRKCTRLIKYLRDIKTTFPIKSILLTTLLGPQVRSLYPQTEKKEFPDVPTALRTLFRRLDDYLQARPT